MQPEDLPRLSDDDREALDDGYIALRGVPASEPATVTESPNATTPHPLTCAKHDGAACSCGDDERERAYWEARGFDPLTRFLLFVLFPVLLIGMLGLLWRVSVKEGAPPEPLPKEVRALQQ